MKGIVWILALVSLAGCVYLVTAGETSFARNSPEQLDVLAAEYLKIQARGGPEAFEATISASILEDERRRRWLWKALLGTAVLLGALGFRIRESVSVTDEESRLVAAVGDPAALAQGERHKAAALLGVAVGAPKEVIAAAFEAQMKQRDLSRLDGLAPDLRRMVHEQREALTKAKELLLRP